MQELRSSLRNGTTASPSLKSSFAPSKTVPARYLVQERCSSKTINTPGLLHPQKQCRSAASCSKAVPDCPSLNSSARVPFLSQNHRWSISLPFKLVPELRFSPKSSARAPLLPQHKCRSVAPPSKAVPQSRSSNKKRAGPPLLQKQCRTIAPFEKERRS